MKCTISQLKSKIFKKNNEINATANSAENILKDKEKFMNRVTESQEVLFKTIKEIKSEKAVIEA